MNVAAPLLLPTPERVEMHSSAGGGESGWIELAPGVVEGIERELVEVAEPTRTFRIGPERGGIVGTGSMAEGRKGYSIQIGGVAARDGVAIAYDGRVSLRHALHTLTQLIRQYGMRLPRMSIQDSPARGFAVRGVMLDVSRDKVPTMAQLRATVDLLASLKFNHLQLYTEHTFAYAGHEEVWRDWSPMTPAEVRELDAYAAARGIELAANQNCFGHLASWLKRPAYEHLAEIEGNNPWYFHQWERRGPFSLCPIEPQAEAFVGELLDQLLPCFASGLVNIGCDETFDVGWGRSKGEIERRAPRGGEQDRERARAQLYFEFVQKIARACAGHGKRPMMWADIALTHPDMLHLLPRDMIGLAWWYEPTEKFAAWIEGIRAAGMEAWVCPGTSSWRTFTGRTSERRGNIADAAEQGKKAGATGFLICDWGDMGHRQQWPIALAGIAQAAEAAWNAGGARAFDPRAAGLHVLGESGALGVWMDELGECDRPIRASAKVLNASALFNDLHPPVPGQLKAVMHEVEATVPEWQAAKERLLALGASRPEVQDAQTRAEVDHAMECALFAADHAMAMRDDGLLHRTRDALIARCEAIKVEHERLWLLRNRPGGMSHASSFYSTVNHKLRLPESGPAAAKQA